MVCQYGHLYFQFESQAKSREFWSKGRAEAQEEFEKALHCVERNKAARGRNQRDWDAPFHSGLAFYS